MFCIATFVTGGLFAAADNHNWLGPAPISDSSLCILAIALGMATVALFGKRAS